jgi:hypothetical protein
MNKGGNGMEVNAAEDTRDGKSRMLTRRHHKDSTMPDSGKSSIFVPAELLESIVAYLQPRRVILFGSQARRDAGAGSDIDLLGAG